MSVLKYKDAEGNWKVFAGGGSGAKGFVVTFTKSGDTYSSDKSFTDVAAAWDAGNIVYGLLTSDGYTANYNAIGKTGTEVVFECSSNDSSSIISQMLILNSDNTIVVQNVSSSKAGVIPVDPTETSDINIWITTA